MTLKLLKCLFPEDTLPILDKIGEGPGIKTPLVLDQTTSRTIDNTLRTREQMNNTLTDVKNHIFNNLVALTLMKIYLSLL